MRPWLTGRAVALHLTATVLVGACAALADWQIHRALGGNELSWAYTFEWPIFGGYVVFMWWKLLHQEPGFETGPRTSVRARARAAARAERDANADRLMEAYNARLAAERESDRKSAS